MTQGTKDRKQGLEKPAGTWSTSKEKKKKKEKRERFTKQTYFYSRITLVTTRVFQHSDKSKTDSFRRRRGE